MAARAWLAGILALAWLLTPLPVRAAEGTGLRDCLDRAGRGWAREVRAGNGSAEALEAFLAGRFEEALERARRDGDPWGAALAEVPLRLAAGDGPGLARLADALEARGEPLLVAWLRYHAGLALASSGRVADAAAQGQASVALFRRGGNPDDLAEALKQWAGAQLLGGRADLAARTYEEAEGLLRSRGRTTEAALLAGMRARALAEVGQLAQAVRIYRESLPVLEAAGQDQRFYSGRSDLGTVLMRQGRYAEAEVELDAAVRHFGVVGPSALALSARINRAGLDLERGHHAEAEARLRACLEEALDPEQDAVVRGNLARTLVARGHYREAEEMLQALAASEEARGARRAAAGVRSALASVYRQQKRLVEAERLWDRVRETWRLLGNPAGEADVLTCLGNLRLNQGRPVEAEELFRQALALYEAQGAEAAAATVRMDLSGALWARGRMEAALQALEAARASFRRLGHRTGLATATFKTALVRLALDQSREALGLLEAVEALYREEGLERSLVDLEHVRAWLESPFDPGRAGERLERVALRLEALGLAREVAGIRAERASLALEAGDAREAGRLVREALAGWKEQDLPLERLGATLTLAGVEALEGRLPEAADLLEELRREARDRGLPAAEAFAAAALARVDLLAGRLREAARAAEAAEALGDELQKDLFYAGGERAAMAEFEPFTSTVARIQVALGRPDRALEALERTRGRLLEVARLRTLAAATSPRGRALLAHLQAAQGALFRARERLEGATPDEREALRAEVDRASRERDRLEVELSRLTRTWDQLRDPSAREIREALPERAALLEYAFLGDGLQVFLVTRDGVSRVMLLPTPPPEGPGDELLEGRRSARVRACVQEVGAERLVDRILYGTEAETRTEARRLWDLLLAPLEKDLEGVDRLLVVPDRDLHFLPFEALQDSQGRWLLERFEVTWMNTARELFLPAPPAGGLPLVVGGPAFTLGGGPVLQGEDLRRLGGPWTELEGAREEARAVAALEGVQALVGSEATESAVRGRAPGSGVLHLATHGFVRALPPGPGTGRLVPRRPQDVLRDCGLALAGANGGGVGGEDGILDAFEVLGLDLGNTGLVVLSACDTGRGELNAYEGVFGLKRSFLAAGARQVVFSLWPVSDAGTRALMTRFYEHLRGGKPVAEALRSARLELLRGDPVLLEEGLAEEPERFQAPRFWAPFAVVGRPDGAQASARSSRLGREW